MLPDGKKYYTFLCAVTTVILCDSVLLYSVESLTCITDSILIESGGCSVMVSSQLMNDLKLKIIIN